VKTENRRSNVNDIEKGVEDQEGPNFEEMRRVF